MKDHHIFRPPIALTDPLVKANPPIFAKVVEASVGYRSDVDEHIFGAVVGLDETVALVVVEKLTSNTCRVMAKRHPRRPSSVTSRLIAAPPAKN
jgi:hypothetical protein